MAQCVRIPEPIGDVSEVEWRRFKKEFKIYLIAAEKDEKEEKVKIALFFNLIGSEAYKLYDSSASRTRKETLDKVIQFYDSYFFGSTNVIFERFKFHDISQKVGERFNDFCLRLRQQASQCSFKEEDEMIRDAIVFGIRDFDVQKELLKERNLTLDSAVEICRHGEVTKERLEVMQASKNMGPEEVTVHEVHGKVRSSGGQSRVTNCKWCGLSHLRGRCPAYGKTCSKCRRQNHFKIVCENFSNRSTKKIQELNEETSTYQISDELNGESENVFSLGLLAMFRHSGDVWMENIQCNDKNMRMKIDTGAQVNILSVRDVRYLGLSEMTPTSTIIEAFGGKLYTPKGYVNVSLKWKNSFVKTTFLVVDGCDHPILGLRDANALHIVNLVSEVRLSNTASTASVEKNKFLDKYSSLFDGLGCLPTKHHIIVNSDIPPVVGSLRTSLPVTAFSLKSKIQEKVEQRIEKSQQRQAYSYNRTAVKDSTILPPKSSCLVQEESRWVPKTVVGPGDTPKSYFLKGEDGRVLKRNLKLVRPNPSRIFVNSTSYNHTNPPSSLTRPKRETKPPQRLNM